VLLVVVDFQLGMLESSAIPLVLGGERPLKRIYSLVRYAREAGVLVVFGQHDRGPGHPLEGGTEECRIRPDVALPYGEPVVRNRLPDSFYGTTLQKVAGREGRGQQRPCRVDDRILRGYRCGRTVGLGYDMTLMEDAHGTWDTDHLPAGPDHGPPQRSARKVVRERRGR
jgi:hypothetical protein